MVARAFGTVGLLYLHTLQGKFKIAKNLYQGGIDSLRQGGQKLWEMFWRRYGALEYLRMGDPQGAMKECEELAKLAQEERHLAMKRAALYTKGLVFLEMGKVTEAQNMARALSEEIDRSLNRNSVKYHHHLMGEISMEKRDFSGAVQYFKKALSFERYSPLAKRADFQYSLATAYHKAGSFDEALKTYEQISSLTSGRQLYGIHYAKSFYMLGKLCQQQGLKDKAIGHYETFLELWKEADPGIPELEDAKQNLSKLRN
jgi:tetratricopeptide (TPR) repeat protein